MNKGGPIIIIEDDMDDQEVFREVFDKLCYPNIITFFGDGIGALEYLTATKEQPFLILCDINLPKLNGFQLRDQIRNNEQLNLKCIPYLFFTTAADQQSVIDAYSKSVQGFFTKPDNYVELLQVVKSIVEYWKICQSPDFIK
jgi:CheY-like chemotaxis protein